MKRIQKAAALLLVGILLLPAVSAVPARAASSEWSGSTAMPKNLVDVDGVRYYGISTGEELAYIAQNGGDWLGYNYILTDDIVLNAEQLTYNSQGNLTVSAASLNRWTPIDGFSGVFNGNGYTISGVYVSESEDAGLFTSCEGDLYNITVTNSYISGGSEVGGIAGSFSRVGGVFQGCSYSGAVVGESKVGGLIGANRCSYISDCVNYGNIWGTGDYVCGIVGHYGAYEIRGCINYGSVTSSGNYVAGIAGHSDIYGISNCINHGDIRGKDYVAGILGCAEDANTYNCRNVGSITGNQYVGGINGYSTYRSVTSYYSYLTACHNSGSVDGVSYVGGITGYLVYSALDTCYNVGNVTGQDNVGAVIGYSDSVWGKGEVTNCHYLQNKKVNTALTGFGNVGDVEGTVVAEEESFFCINEDATVNTDHVMDSEEIVKEANCTEDGLILYTCTGCGKTVSETIPANFQHVYHDSCDVDCDLCGEVRDVTHSYDGQLYADESGHWYACSICDERSEVQQHYAYSYDSDTNSLVCAECGYVVVFGQSGSQDPAEDGGTDQRDDKAEEDEEEEQDDPVGTGEDGGVSVAVTVVVGAVGLAGGVAIGLWIPYLLGRKKTK